MQNNIFKIGLLQCDHVLEENREIAGGDYSEIFTQIFSESANRLALSQSIQVVSFPVIDNCFPKSSKDCNAWVISGSKHSVYDTMEWVENLKEFVLEIANNNLPLVGICFGHQIIALALGANVVERDEWIVGIQNLKFNPSIFSNLNSVKLHGVHVYEVVSLPKNALLLASTDYVEIASFIIPPNIFCLQYHFEFKPNFMRKLIEDRREIIGEVIYKKALLGMSLEEKDEFFCDEILRSCLSYL